jgi:hypothetical protein
MPLLHWMGKKKSHEVDGRVLKKKTEIGDALLRHIGDRHTPGRHDNPD